MAQMPGEARGYQFAPPQAAGTPAAMVDNFTQIEDLQTLIAMQQRNPSIPLLAHIDEVRKKLQAKQAVANNLAMRQAQQQGLQTLNDQILGSAAQVAGMAPVRRMAAGGIVTFTNGGLGKSASEISDQELFQAYRGRGGLGYASALLGERPEGRNSPAQQAWDANKRALDARLPAVIQAQGRQPVPAAAASTPAAAPVDVLQQAFSPEAQQGRVAEGLNIRAAAAGAVPETVRPNATRGAAGAAAGTGTQGRNTSANKPTQERRQETPPAAAASAAAPDPLFDAYTAIANAYRLPVTTPEIQAQRKGIANLQDLYAQQVSEDAKRVRDESERELARREGRLNKPFLEGDMLPLLASFLSAKKGEFFPSLAKGLAAVSTEEEKARKELAQYRTTEGERVRQLNNLYRQMQIEQAKYNMALSEGDFKTAREAQEKLAEATFKYKVESEKLATEKMKAQAEITRAGKPTDFELFMRNPERFRDYMGARTGPRDEAALTAANARLTAALNNDPILATLRKRAENAVLTTAEQAAIMQAMEARIRQLKIENAPESAALGQAAGTAGASTGTSVRSTADRILEGTR